MQSGWARKWLVGRVFRVFWQVCSLGEPVLVERHDSGAEQAELAEALRDYAGRETPLYHAERLSEYYKSINNGKGPDIYLKREDLNHGGSHKMNNALAQAMIAKRMGCKSVVTATSFGQHDLATAVACAKLALECMIFMANFALKVMNNEFLRYACAATEAIGPAPTPPYWAWVTDLQPLTQTEETLAVSRARVAVIREQPFP
ncbi:Tryptophan synthase beta chain 2 [Vigna angularis]|uniref:tryptophan synthase n=1 Tax=Phaseolus angularis TaxID=3914 RepID=A0A8T0LD62_PHAAN|nr:Tryptophan synthase beta chain 2 [Vigna angularis]